MGEAGFTIVLRLARTTASQRRQLLTIGLTLTIRESFLSPANDREWWTVFNDPVLDSLVQSTYQGNLPLLSQGQRVLEYRAARAIVAGNLFPQSQTLDGFYKHLQISRAGNLPGVPIPDRVFDLWNVGPQLQWELDVWGRFRRRIEQADADLERQVELYDDVLSIAVADTAKAYIEMRTAQEFVRLAAQNVEIQQGSLKIADTRFKEGATGELDVTQAQSTLRETTALIPAFQRDLRQANLDLCNLLGIPMRDLTPQTGEGSIPVVPTSVAVEIPANLMRRRPDVRAAERAVASASMPRLESRLAIYIRIFSLPVHSVGPPIRCPIFLLAKPLAESWVHHSVGMFSIMGGFEITSVVLKLAFSKQRSTISKPC